jgi:hypothetical protein
MAGGLRGAMPCGARLVCHRMGQRTDALRNIFRNVGNVARCRFQMAIQVTHKLLLAKKRPDESNPHNDE